MAAAANGELNAFRTLAREGAELAARDRDELAAFEALIFARLAFARSGSASDASLVLSVIAVAQTFAETQELIDALQAEAIARASLLADAGDESAGDWLAALVENSTEKATADAQVFRARLIEQPARD